MARRTALAFATAAAALVLVIVGVALIYPPLAFITAGAAVGATLFVDVTPPKRGAP